MSYSQLLVATEAVLRVQDTDSEFTPLKNRRKLIARGSSVFILQVALLSWKMPINLLLELRKPLGLS